MSMPGMVSLLDLGMPHCNKEDEHVVVYQHDTTTTTTTCDHTSLSLDVDDTTTTPNTNAATSAEEADYSASPNHTPRSLHLSNDPVPVPVPFIGQRFPSHDSAYHFYTAFAKRSGFSIRRHRTDGKPGVGKGFTRRYFVCHRAGNTPAKLPPNHNNKPQRNRKSSRCGCRAYLRITKTSPQESEWRVTGFVNHHNHDLLQPNQVRFLPAYRTISDSDKTRIYMYAKAGISVQKMMRLLELENSLQPGYLPFTEKDVRNLIQSFKKADPQHDNTAIDVDLLKMCRNLKEKDHNFRFDYTLDSDNNLHNIAWSYASSIEAYHMFGDAVVFDTTHRLTAFDMPLGIWLGINNYGMPCFFGCVLLRDENFRSFSWAIKVFLGFMNGKAPRTMLTDQNMCLKEAVALEMPTSKHALCIWLLVAKFPSWFNAVLGDRYNDWKAEFCRLYNLESIDEFELGWRDMVNSFGLHTNRHIANLFALRSLWALSYLRSHFMAGLTTTGQSKSINAFIQRFLSAQSWLAHFVEQVAVAVDFNDQAGEQQTMQQNLQNINLKTGAPMESHAASVLTPFAFSKLQEQLILAAHYASFQIEDGFLIRHHTKLQGGRKVYWDTQEGIISCSCDQFEFSGILCRHALRVLSTGNCFQIPERYLPPRWRRVNSFGSKLQCNLIEHGEKVQRLQNMVSTLVSESSKSIECLDLATEQVSILLSQIREQPVSTSLISRDAAMRRNL